MRLIREIKLETRANDSSHDSIQGSIKLSRKHIVDEIAGVGKGSATIGYAIDFEDTGVSAVGEADIVTANSESCDIRRRTDGRNFVGNDIVGISSRTGRPGPRHDYYILVCTLC